MFLSPSKDSVFFTPRNTCSTENPSANDLVSPIIPKGNVVNYILTHNVSDSCSFGVFCHKIVFIACNCVWGGGDIRVIRMCNIVHHIIYYLALSAK